MNRSREELLSHFVGWTRQNITGDEKGEAQAFIDWLIKAFGQPGARDVGGTFEHRVKRSADSGGGTTFADYVWKPLVLIEMKSRGTDLSRHYRQAFGPPHADVVVRRTARPSRAPRQQQEKGEGRLVYSFEGSAPRSAC
jgi:hypothetical protein